MFYGHYLQSYSLIFIQCAFQNFMVKLLFQFKTKHVNVILEENYIPPGRSVFYGHYLQSYSPYFRSMCISEFHGKAVVTI